MFSPDQLTAASLQNTGENPRRLQFRTSLERSIYALTPAGYLVESGLPFIFKGGTSLLLHLPTVRPVSH